MNLKIMLLSWEFPPNMSGGIGTYTNNLALSLRKRGVETLVVCGYPSRLMGRKEEYTSNEKNLHIIRLPTPDYPPRSEWFLFRNAEEIAKAAAKCDLIHGDASLFYPILKKLHKKWVATIHGEPSNDLRVALHYLFEGRVNLGDVFLNVIGYPYTRIIWDIHVKKADHLIVVSKSLLQDLKSRYGEEVADKCSVIYHAINFDYLYSLINKGRETISNSDSITLFFAGRLYWRKGIMHLLEAVKYLASDYTPHFKLKIFGGGPLGNEILERINSYDLKNKVSFHGFVPYGKLIAEMFQSDIVIAPTLYEAGPCLYVLEAMALAKPVIGFDFPFMREVIIDGKTGILMKAEDIEGLANSILYLLQDEKMRRIIGRNAFRYIQKHHNWDNTIKEYLAIYERCIEENTYASYLQ